MVRPAALRILGADLAGSQEIAENWLSDPDSGQGSTRTGTLDQPATFCMLTRLQPSQITS
jgi:hypothetical protein